MINKWIQFTVSAENSNNFAAALKVLEKESAIEQGCVLYKAFKAEGTEDRFTVLESWATAEDFENHRVAAHIQEFKNNCGSMILEKKRSFTNTHNGG